MNASSAERRFRAPRAPRDRRRRVGEGAAAVDGRRRRADRRPVDDQHRHRRRRGDGASDRGAGPRRLGTRAPDRRPRRGRRRGAPYPRPARRDGRDGPADRRLPLYRPQAARRSSGLRRGARQIPHQSGQRRLQEQARPAIRPDRRDRDPQRQGGADRGELGIARPGAADAPDGRERRERGARSTRARSRARRWSRSALLSAERAEEIGSAARADHPVGQSLGGAGSDHRLPHARASARTMRSISASPKPAWARRGSSPRRRRSAFCCRRASATRSAFRSPPSRAATARRRCESRRNSCRPWDSAIFAPQVAACPGCGRTTSTVFQELARDIQAHLSTSMPEWRARYPGVERLNVAVMGCIVNGPGREQARRHRHLAARHGRARRRRRCSSTASRP